MQQENRAAASSTSYDHGGIGGGVIAGGSAPMPQIQQQMQQQAVGPALSSQPHAAEAAEAAEGEGELTAEQLMLSDVQLWEQLLLGSYSGQEIAQHLSAAMDHPFREDELPAPQHHQQQQHQHDQHHYHQYQHQQQQQQQQIEAQYNFPQQQHFLPRQHQDQHQHQHQAQHQQYAQAPQRTVHYRETIDLTAEDDDDYPAGGGSLGGASASYQSYHSSQGWTGYSSGQAYQPKREEVPAGWRESFGSLPPPSYAASYSSYYAQSTSSSPSLARQFYPKPTTYYRRMEVFFRLLSLTHFTITGRPKERMSELLSTIKLIPGAEFDAKTRKWKFPISSLGALETAIAENCKSVDIHSIPQHILQMMTLAAQRRNADAQAGDAEQFLQERLHARLLRALAPFQREGVAFILKRDGRALLADEMGLGKTIQALAAASTYTEDWPVLIICPSSARYHWRNEIVQWCAPELAQESDVVVISSGNQDIPQQKKFYVISYSLVTTMQAELEALGCQTIIADECHYLKNLRAKRTKAILPMLHSARRAIMLSGTPALSRPYELFPQLHAVDPRSWPSQKEFGRRYCRSKRKRSGAADFRGATNVSELHALLKGTLMIRRRKRDILKQLPPKVRHFEHTELQDEKVRSELQELLEQVSLLDVELAKRKNTITREEKADLKRERKSALLSLFTKSGAAKLPITLQWLAKRLDDVTSGKLLVFGHHRQVLDGVQEYLMSRGVRFIRIDGSTAPGERQSRADHFQTSSSCRVAILGIAAAGIALTLTAASTVLFAELFWTPGALVQAEDRAHRIGQTSEVHVTYILTKDTVDDVLWPLVQKKMQTLGEVVEGEENVGMGTDAQVVQRAASSTDADAAAAARKETASPTNNLEELVEELAAEEQAEVRVEIDNEEDDGETKDGSATAEKLDDEEDEAQEWQEDEADEDDELAEVSAQQRSRYVSEVVDLVSDDDEGEAEERGREADDERKEAAAGSTFSVDGGDRKRPHMGEGSAYSSSSSFGGGSMSSSSPFSAQPSLFADAGAEFSQPTEYRLARPPLVPERSTTSEYVSILDDTF